MAGIYIHIPFCKQACHYCDFHFSTNQQIKAELAEAISKEIRFQQHYLEGEQIKTIYIGGGTPSLLSLPELILILKTIKDTQPVIDNAEITLEANPDDLTPAKLGELLAAGINRLSIGIQSFHPSLLAFLNRAHDAPAAHASVRSAYEAGFKNISIDLMYAMPNETDRMWIEDIQQAISFQPEHISSYSLTIEAKTVFGKWSTSGKLKPVADETAARHMEILMHELGKNGYEHYEISNFARPGYYSQHNSNYWRQEHYLGIGPSAHSYDGISRQFNINNNHLYIKAIRENKLNFEREVLTRENKINEYILTTLRTSWGTNLHELKKAYQYDLLTQHTDYLNTLV
jgi:oxygen-independent coproporphyrinogen-3 oxidase